MKVDKLLTNGIPDQEIQRRLGAVAERNNAQTRAINGPLQTKSAYGWRQEGRFHPVPGTLYKQQAQAGQGTMQVQALFRTVVADLDAVNQAYQAGGLLTNSGAGSLAWTLLGGNENADRFQRDALLVDALIRNRVARLVFDRSGPRHIVVFGGNNVGKSTVVNVLAAASVARTSPEGGHTRHAQAFTAANPPLLFTWNPYAFNRFKQVSPDQLSAEDFGCYAVSVITHSALPSDVVLWDSPDCDSVGSSRYQAAVVETVAAADLVIYVTSVEKYAVADLVEWLFDLDDAGIPILECLNKTPGKDRAQVIRKQTDDVFPATARRLDLPAPSPRVVALRYMIDGEEPDLWGADHPEAAELREAALGNLATHDDHAQAWTALQSVQRRLEHVLEPARAELAVRAKWKSTVGTAIAGFVSTYETHYLAGSSVIDPFKKLNAELLEMLNPNIPHLNEVVRALRVVQRIPLDLLKAVWRRGTNLVADRGELAKDARLAPEARAYATAHRALLISILDQIDNERRVPRHHPFWDRLAEDWDVQAGRLASEFSRATVKHMARTDAEIRAAARDILQALQQRPNVLGLLRAARVSTDIGGLVIGFVLPGHGSIVHDLLKDIVIAPAMLGATGLAAEAAVEGYVAQRRNQIIEKLLAEAREMAATLYAMPFDAMGNAVMQSVGALGVQQDVLDRLPLNLQRLRLEIASHATGAGA